MPIVRAMTLAVVSLCLASCGATSNPGPDASDHKVPAPSNAGSAGSPQPAKLPTGEYACGGVANLPCPQGKECADIPEDSCDPAQGGRDCRGVCIDRTTETAGTEPPGGCVSPDPQKKKYIGNSPGECARIRFVCDAGMSYFSDSCGCGCAVKNALP